jgi:hypothetical protein
MILGGLSIISILPVFEAKFTYSLENKGFGNAIWTNFFGEIREKKGYACTSFEVCPL